MKPTCTTHFHCQYCNHLQIDITCWAQVNMGGGLSPQADCLQPVPPSERACRVVPVLVEEIIWAAVLMPLIDEDSEGGALLALMPQGFCCRKKLSSDVKPCSMRQ